MPWKHDFATYLGNEPSVLYIMIIFFLISFTTERCYRRASDPSQNKSYSKSISTLPEGLVPQPLQRRLGLPCRSRSFIFLFLPPTRKKGPLRSVTSPYVNNYWVDWLWFASSPSCRNLFRWGECCWSRVLCSTTAKVYGVTFNSIVKLAYAELL